MALKQNYREFRRHALTPLEAERISQRACPQCGKDRDSFNRRNKSLDAVCCSPVCSKEYWEKQRPTWADLRRRIHEERGGKCAKCGVRVPRYDPWVLDHIKPIARGGDMWDESNLQILCSRCNKAKTARDLGDIASYKRYPNSRPTLQKSLLEDAP